MDKSSETYRAIADSLYDWLDDHKSLVAGAIECAVAEYIRNYGLPKIHIKKEKDSIFSYLR